MKNKILCILVIMAMSLSGCSTAAKQNEVEQKNEEHEQETNELEEIDVVLDWYPNAVHGFIYEAIDKGYYEQEGLKVNILFPSNTNDAISLTAAGKADVGIYYMQDVVMARVNEDIPVKAIGTIVQAPLSIILSLKEKNIETPADLVGKKVGYSGTALSEAYVETIIEYVGENKDDLEFIDVGFDIMSSITTGNVDATIGAMINHEVPQMEEQGLEVNYFLFSQYGVPDYYELVFVAGEKQLDESSEKLAKFLKASKKGFDDMKANKEEALEILLKYQNINNFPLSESVEKKSLEYLIPVMETENIPFLHQGKEVWQNNIDWLFEKGLINEKIDASEMIAELNYGK